MNYNNYNSVPNDPEFEMMLRRAYDTDSDEEKEVTLKMIEDDPLNRDIFEGILMIKKRKGFSSIEEHLQAVEEDKKKFRNFFNEFKAKGAEKRKQKINLIVYSTAAAIVGCIISFGIFQLTIRDYSSDDYTLQALSDSLEQERNITANLIIEKQRLEEKQALMDSELISVKQSIDSLKQEETSLSTLRKENTNLVTEISQKDAEINILNSEVNLLQQNMKGYSKIDNAKRFMALSSGECERIVDPTYHGNIMGGHEKLDLEIKSPKNLDFYLKNQPLEFAWKTKEKGKASLSCFLAMNDELVFEKEILLESEKEVLEKNTLNYGTYYWMISQEEAVSDIQYFIIISW